MTHSAAEVHKLKQAHAADHRIIPVVLHRWSPRAFSAKPVSDADLRTIFEAVRWTPSSFNEQPWRFLVGKQGSETYAKIHDSLVEFNQMWAGKAPVLILGAAKMHFTHNNSHNGYAFYDLGAAAGTLVLQAAELGLMTHQMAGVHHDKAREAFGIPEDFHIGAAIALGYQGEPSTLTHEQMLKQEVSPRSRKELNEFVLSGWGEALHLG
jgi:nitroreductase